MDCPQRREGVYAPNRGKDTFALLCPGEPRYGDAHARVAAYPIVTLGVGVTRLVPDRVGVDFSIGTAPQVVADGLYPVAARLGPSIPLEIGRDVFLIPSAGVTGIAFPGSHEWQGTSGWYCGGAAVLARGSVGFRAGVTFLGQFGAPPQLWLAEIGVMHVPLPRRTR